MSWMILDKRHRSDTGARVDAPFPNHETGSIEKAGPTVGKYRSIWIRLSPCLSQCPFSEATTERGVRGNSMKMIWWAKDILRAFRWHSGDWCSLKKIEILF